VNPRPRTLAAIALALALLAQTWLWIGVMGAPIGYTLDVPVSMVARTQFLMGGPFPELGPSRTLRLSAGPYSFEEDWELAAGGGVHISESIAPYAILLGGEPSLEDVLAAVSDRSRWRETTALGGRVNALQAHIGRITISIEGDLSYDDLFRIARSLRPGFASLL
jgi:hypothetical protein